MQRIAKFYKVSEKQFQKDFMKLFPEYDFATVQQIYQEIQLPERATKGSAGYDFFAPVSFTLKPGESIKIATGVRVWMEDGWVLKCYPRSGHGFKFRLQLDNTVGIIDSDYYTAPNEGHLFVKLTNDSREEKMVSVAKGEGMFQGIFLEYGITLDDEAENVREGGFGSTTKDRI